MDGGPRQTSGAVDVGADELNIHLYHVGYVLPGKTFSMRVVGPPGANIRLGTGNGVLDPPFTTPYGDLFLAPPVVYNLVGQIPPGGILKHEITTPGFWISGDEHPFQAMVGATLSNLDIVLVD